MAKKEKTDAAPAKEAAKKKGNMVYRLVKSPGEKDKLGKQARAILTALEKGPLTRDELLKKLEGKVETVQPLNKILSFYQASLRDGGYLEYELK